MARLRSRSYPPSVWTPPPPPPSTGATAGIPGAWTPAGSTPPASVAALIAGTPNPVVASPVSVWTVGQYVQTATAGVPGRASWSGTAWIAGAAPAAATTGTTTEEPCPPDDTPAGAPKAARKP